MRPTMSSQHKRSTIVAASSSTADRADARFGERLWSALHVDDLSLLSRNGGLPVSRLAMPDKADPAYYTVTAIDVSGRLADRSALVALAWQPGHAVAMSVLQGAVVVVSSRDGLRAVTRQGHLRLPA